MHTCSRLINICQVSNLLQIETREKKIRCCAPSSQLRNSNCEHKILPISYALEFEHGVDAFSQFLWRHAEGERELERGGVFGGHFKVSKIIFCVRVGAHGWKVAHGRLHRCTSARRVFTFLFALAGLAEPRREVTAS